MAIQTFHIDITLEKVLMQTFERSEVLQLEAHKRCPIVFRKQFCNNITDIIMKINKYISLRCLVVISPIKHLGHMHDTISNEHERL